MFASASKPPDSSQSSQNKISQSEVERLLALVGENDPSAPGGETGGAQAFPVRHDFPQASSFSEVELRDLRLRCESFIRSVAARLTVHFNLECAMQMNRLEAVRFEPFVETLANPTHVTLFRLEPLRGVCLLELPPRLALSIVDRELGGPAAASVDIRELTPIEGKLAAKVLGMILVEWCNTWTDTLQLRPSIIRSETSGRYLQTCSPPSRVIVMGIETRLAQTTEQIQLAFPQTNLEPLLLKLNSNSQHEEKPEPAHARTAVKWNPGLNDVPVLVTARWRGMELTARQILGLKPGDIVPLQPATTSQVQLSLDATLKFAGQLGASGRQLAVRIFKVI